MRFFRNAWIFVLLGMLANTPLATAQEVTAKTVFAKSSPSVVQIVITTATGKGSGSGFVVKADGVIVTNFHVIAHAKSATVFLANGDAYDDVSVYSVDRRKDLAVIKIKAIGLPVINVGRSNAVQIGDQVYAIGNPEGLQNTLSSGLISGIRAMDGYSLFQTSTPISPGSSGGPLLNAVGQVVAVTTLQLTEGQNLNFAVPIDYVLGMLDPLGTPQPLSTFYVPEDTKQSSNQTQTSDDQAQLEAAVIQERKTVQQLGYPDYFKSKLGKLNAVGAEWVFGKPIQQRDATDSRTGRKIGDVFMYKTDNAFIPQFELNFSAPDARLAAAYLYISTGLSWDQFKHQWGGNAQKQRMDNGSVFYNYRDRPWHVMVRNGIVISLGVWSN